MRDFQYLNFCISRNALSEEMMKRLIAVLDEIERDDFSRVVVLRSSCNVFSSGHDLKEIVSIDFNFSWTRYSVVLLCNSLVYVAE